MAFITAAPETAERNAVRTGLDRTWWALGYVLK
jgi:hypothetical protein